MRMDSDSGRESVGNSKNDQSANNVAVRDLLQDPIVAASAPSTPPAVYRNSACTTNHLKKRNHHQSHGRQLLQRPMIRHPGHQG
ncbi:AAEL009103-PA [Aedes aegypti]|uniref:AAEL009103-PA n=1 Tax=Aedes aegypti TaxID=7159 RepID=Q16WT8_AEDAE|nr:AAEL009103-PA [Aedes aegypti]